MREENPDRSLRGQHLLTLIVLCLAAVAGATVLQLTGSQAFQPYYGSINPVLGTSGVVALGLGSLVFLQSRGWLFIDKPPRGRARFVLPAVLAAVLAVPVIAVDLAGGFPDDINVLPPQALLFYPVIALVAETVFHVAPLALLILLAGQLAGSAERGTVLVVCLFVVALPEPVFQVVAASDVSPWWATVYVAFHLWIFNLLAVYLFNRNGFFSMLAFRLTYYLLWHVTWGVIRLRVLF